MTSKNLSSVIIIALLTTLSCNSDKKQTTQDSETESTEMIMPVTGDNSQNALDWDGVYQGTIPCADCEGIETVLVLNRDLSYIHKTKYLGKSDSIYESAGSFKWNESGSDITLTSNDNIRVQFKVGENQLFMLDQEGQRITGDLADTYILKKDTIDIVEKYWKLVELNGGPVETKEGQREAFLILKAEDNRAHGNGGCNTFNGSYELQDGNRVQFSKMATTLMACPAMETEQQFVKVLEMADNYNATETTLILNKARMAPLAKFEVVYFK